MEVLASIRVVNWASINCFRVEGSRWATRDQSIGRYIIQMTGTIFFIGRTIIVLFKLHISRTWDLVFLHKTELILCIVLIDLITELETSGG